MTGRVVIIQGSPSDDAYVEQITATLAPYGLKVERRTASAHRNAGDQNHLALVLGQYDPSDVFVTVAGLSDALSGRVAADFPERVVASPPDAKQYGESKMFSSTRTPRGIEIAGYARTPQETADLVATLVANYDAGKVGTLIQQNQERALQNIMHDARQQGFEEPVLPHTAFRRGKTRDVYQPDKDTLLIRATDRVSAFDVVLPNRVPGKGQSLVELSEYWFKLTEGIFPNHFLERTDERTMRVRKADRIDVEWIVRGYLYGSLARAYARGERTLYGLTLPDGLSLASPFPEPILTPTTKAETGHDEPLTKEEAIAKGLVRDAREWDIMARATFKLYEFYKQHALERGIVIPDFKLEFGRVNGGYMQIDEPPTHDSARFWATQFHRVGQKQEGHALDKEFLRQYLLDTGYDGNGPAPHLPELVIEQVSRRCVGATEALTGRFEALTGKQPSLTNGLMTVEQVLQKLKVK